jgi:hypothetical protein
MLSEIRTKFETLAAGITGRPSRDELAKERDLLLSSPPEVPPSGVLDPPLALACQCPHCQSRAAEEQGLRVGLAAWQSRVGVVASQLWRKTFGDETERDAVGETLAELCDELLKAFERERAQPWVRTITVDGRGRPVSAYETSEAIAEKLRELAQLRRRALDVLPFFAHAELVSAIARVREEMSAIVARPLRRAIEPSLAARAGTEPARTDEAQGLVPVPGRNIIEGTIKLSRKGRA